MKKKEMREIGWDKLDNTAHIFPVIAGEAVSNVYRISVVLKEEIQGDKLQEALAIVLPKFSGFNVRLRRGIFWYYFEENGKSAPEVEEEKTYPCRYIEENKNHSYLFRVTYYGRRINLEVFHVLTDGMGGLNFLKELTYQYLRLVHPKLREQFGDNLSQDTSLNREDSFLKNYKKNHAKAYQSQRAYQIKAEKLRPGEFGVMHGRMSVSQLKEVCHRYHTTINVYLVSCFVWAVYTECMNQTRQKRPLRVAVPVNLRPYFNSITTKNFFVMVSAEFLADREDYTFSDILEVVKKSLETQITKEHLEEIFSYNVGSEKNLIARVAPLFLKNLAIRAVYTKSALANSTTITNIGNVKVEEAYQSYIESFHAYLAVSKGQNLKGTICSYGDTLVFTFSSVLRDTSVQKAFFRQIASDGVEVFIETNGVY
ncbi:MAG: hypothetical protein ACI4HI_02880 [Lachnospiraceae bacterium]